MVSFQCEFDSWHQTGLRMASSDQNLLVSGSESSSPARAIPTAPNKSARVRHRFSCWSFHLTFSVDSTALNGGRTTGCVTLGDREMLLRSHIKSRLENTMPALVAAFANKIST